jgi:hypothetical protein
MPDTADAEMTDAKPDASTFELQGIIPLQSSAQWEAKRSRI